MSIAARDWAWAVRGLVTGPRLVLLALAERADDGGVAWPSIGALAHACEMTPRNVQNHVRTLRSAGLVSVERRGRQSNVYRLAGITKPTSKNGTSSQALVTQATSPQSGATDEAYFTQDTKPTSSVATKSTSPRTVTKEPSLEPSKSTTGVLANAGAPTPRATRSKPRRTAQGPPLAPLFEAFTKHGVSPPAMVPGQGKAAQALLAVYSPEDIVGAVDWFRRHGSSVDRSNVSFTYLVGNDRIGNWKLEHANGSSRNGTSGSAHQSTQSELGQAMQREHAEQARRLASLGSDS